MKTPPIEWEDAITLGMDVSSVVSCDGNSYTIEPPTQKLIMQLFRELAINPVPENSRIAYMRHIRDLLIGLTDWTQVADSPLTQDKKQLWAIYRQALRDLPSVWDGNTAIPWPNMPT
jgi:hypothetical protein